MKKTVLSVALGLGVLTIGSLSSQALDYSFTGNFTYDNDVQLFSFTVGAASPSVTLRTWSYAGGVNAAGQTIARNGFDPILALFNNSGALVGQNDDGGSLVAADAVTGAHYDTYLSVGSLAAGTYTVAVMQYDNFAVGPNISNGFRYPTAASQWFTQALTGHTTGGFYDVAGGSRDNHWAFDILGVEQATQNPVPDGGLTLMLLGSAFGGLAFLRKRVA